MAIKDTIKDNPVVSAAVGLMVLLSGVNVTTVVSGVRYFDSVATKEYVTQQIGYSQTQTDTKIDELSKSVDRVRAYTEVVPELRNLLVLKCMGTDGLEATISRLKTEYRRLTGEEYVEPPCERLVAGPSLASESVDLLTTTQPYRV